MQSELEIRNKAVAFPVVVPFYGIEKDEQPDGVVFLQEGRATNSIPVASFVRQGSQSSLRHAALTQLANTSVGLRAFDQQLVKNLRPLFRSTFGEKLTDAILETLKTDPVEFTNRWFVPLWNEAMNSVRFVMVWWKWPRGSRSAALYCPGPEGVAWPERARRARDTALFVTALSLANSLGNDISEGRVVVCPGCGDWFKPDRTNKKYHNKNCAARHRNQRKRDRDKRLRKKSAKKGKSRGEN
jgi:hypothetical protein